VPLGLGRLHPTLLSAASLRRLGIHPLYDLREKHLDLLSILQAPLQLLLEPVVDLLRLRPLSLRLSRGNVEALARPVILVLVE
jgi:hypothetical protein